MDTTLESKSYKFVYSISFSKNGKYTSNTECYFESGNKNYDLVEEGNWSFVLKNKSGDLKNKEAIELFRSSSNYIEYEDTPANEEITTYIYSIIPESPSFFLIDRLTKDELILTTSNALNSNLINSAMGYTSAYTSTYNMKQTFQAK
jgi:hypothetical protein